MEVNMVEYGRLMKVNERKLMNKYTRWCMNMHKDKMVEYGRCGIYQR